MISRAAPFLLSQAGWIAVATLAAHDRGISAVMTAAAVALAIVLLSRQRARTALFAAAAAVMGPLADVPLARAGLIILHEPLLLGAVMPLWWWGLWAMFGAALPASFGWLRGRTALAAILGALGGPPAYAAGAGLGAIALPSGAWPSLVAIGAVWAVLMPLAVLAASHVVAQQEPKQ